MDKKFLKIISSIIIDPYTGENLSLIFKDKKNVKLKSKNNKIVYDNKIGAISFVDAENYAKNFGDQWNKFPKLQLDSFSGTSISNNRFWKSWNLYPTDFKNKLVLDVGCGTGRFAEIALKAGAYVIAIDYSSAANVAAKNLINYEKFLCLQADIYNLPFKKNSFDYIYCLGVLQHTPDVEKAFKSLPKFVKKNGRLCVDYYRKNLYTFFGWKYPIRIITKYFSEKSIFSFLRFVHPFFYKISDFFSKVPVFGRFLTRLVPVVNYRNIHKLSDKQLQEWSLLDTYDNWAPKYDNPQTIKTITKWAEEEKLKEIETEISGHLVLRAKVN